MLNKHRAAVHAPARLQAAAPVIRQRPTVLASRRVASSTATALTMIGVVTGAHAVVVRGRVTDPLDKPVPGARVQLIESGQAVAAAFAGLDGSYEIRSGDAGRFTLLGSFGGYLPSIGVDFYGGSTDVVNQNVVLSMTEVRQEVSVTASGVPTPLPQLTAPVKLIGAPDLLTRVGILAELRQTPGVSVVQTGQAGSVTSLFVRGGPSDGNKVVVDGVPAEDVGGGFDFGTVSSTGIGSVELYRDPNAALYGSDSQTGVVSISTPRGATYHPLLTYSGDGGTLYSYRNEVTASGTLKKFDYLAGYSRFDTSNALPHDRYHDGTAVANLGYNLFKGASLRGTVRNSDSAEGLPDAHDFYGISQDAKEGDQDLYGNLVFDYRTDGNWHNLVRYGITRKREQANYFGEPGETVTINDPVYGPYQVQVGDYQTIRGANGFAASGQAQFFFSDYNQDNNRDELYYQTDYIFPKRITGLFGFRYDNERGSFVDSYDTERIQRRNYEWNLQFQGDIRSRVFYSFGGSLQKNHLYGYAGEPRLGLAYVPVRPGHGFFHGTKLRANLATGVQEPSLATEFSSLYRQLEAAGDQVDLTQYGIQPLGPERSRSADLGLDQELVAQKLRLSVDYFHNQFSHQVEDVADPALEQYFGFVPKDPSLFVYGAELNSMAYRAQGAEAVLEWEAGHHFFVRGGYTYLDARVSQSFASDVIAQIQEMPTENPNLPGLAIGGLSPLVGARPFRRAPHTGFFDVVWNPGKLSLALKGAAASRSDDSTYLENLDVNAGNTLLLPNRNLDFAYLKLDLGGQYQLRRHIALFTQVDNLANDQHIGPIGYPALPFTVRAGVKVRLGGE